ncbi:MAG: ATP-grasp domain-containing protein [Betaproteobacteria bacterium]|nr:ATP-grasp domain-containing protein [Betaproteobacteria bacterium]
MTRKRILVLFPDEWDRWACARHEADKDFLFEGFDLFRFPENARLFTFDVQRFVDRLFHRYRSAGLDGVLTADEQFGSVVAPLLASRLGLPHTPLMAVLTAQHKFMARQAFQQAIPGANPRFGLIDRDFRRTGSTPLPFPFYVKPVKATFSVLARRVDSFAQLDRHLRFSWFEQAIIERLVKPFGDVMRRHATFEGEAFSMIAEEIVEGQQVTVNGFARGGNITMLGVVDSIMYPGTDQFQRFQYPSALPADVQERAEAVTRRALAAIGFTHGMFNVELRICENTGQVKLIEINPRTSGQFFDLFEHVDGYNLFDVLLAIASGQEPVIRHREGRNRVAASFVLRDLHGEGLSRWPRKAEIDGLRERHPQSRILVFPKRGAGLRRELKWLSTYRYAVINLGAPSPTELYSAFERIRADIDFHPRGRAVPDLDGSPARASWD